MYAYKAHRTRRTEARLCAFVPFDAKASRKLAPKKKLMFCFHVSCIIPHIFITPAKSSCTILQHVRIYCAADSCWRWCTERVTERVNPSYQPVSVCNMPVPSK